MRHIKCLLLFISVFNIDNKINAQGKTKYSIGTFMGLTQNLGKQGPKQRTEVSNVSFIRPIAKTFGFSFDLKPQPKYSLGLEFAYNEFECGYKAKSKFQTSGITSGLLLSADRISIYKAGVRFSKSILVFRGLFFNAIFTPSLAYSKYLTGLADTSLHNGEERVGGGSDVQYFRYPAYQNTGLHFVIKTTMELQYKFRNNISVTLDAAYQQGFRPFVVDTVNIVRQYEPNALQHKYWTRFSGTSFQFHIGMKYDF